MNQLNFDSHVITMEFDKYMVNRSVESSIFFPPFESKDLEFDWSGKEVEITVNKPFEKDRTYIFTIGARAQDLRGNYLGKAFDIVFSTGSQIDTGTVAGTVYSSKAQPYTVAAFPVNSDIDTLRPNISVPRYVTQSDDSGSYVLQGLAKGKYRLICFDDQMRNFIYAPQIDLYSSATHDVDVMQETQAVTDVNFMVGMEDTSRPQLYSAQLANDGLLLLKFSEPIDTAHLRPSYFVVRDSATGDTIPVDFAARLESNEYNAVIRTKSPLILRTKYFVTATDSAKDNHGNAMSADNNFAVLEADSAAGHVSPYYFSSPDSLKGVTSYDTMFCQFVIGSMNGVPTNPQVSLVDSNGAVMTGFVARESQTMFRVRLAHLRPFGWYTLRLEYHSYAGGTEEDSVAARRFMMADSATLGDVEGTVAPVYPGRGIVVAAEGKAGKTFYAMADSTGNFRLDGIPAGDYRLLAYLKHGNGMRYFSGKSFPYTFAEPFGVYGSAVKVRARWTVEGVSITMH